MAVSEDIGIIEDLYEEKNFEWKVIDYFSVTNNKLYITSPVFSFGQASFCLHMQPKSLGKPNFSVLYLNPMKRSDYVLECECSLKRLDGTVENLGKTFLGKRRSCSGPIHFKPLEMQEQECQKVSLDVFSITCKLKHRRTNSDLLSMLNESKPMELIKMDTLSNNLKDLLANKESCDTTLLVQDREFKAHRAILIARSPVFAAMFLHDTSEKKSSLIIIPDCDPESFKEFLEFLYCGKLIKPSFRSVTQLYKTADKYQILELKTFCLDYLMGNLAVGNFCDVVIFAEKYDEEILLNAAQGFFNKNLNKIFITSEWEYLVKNNYHISRRLLAEMSSNVIIVE